MTPASPLEAQIDRLYALPLDQFVQARNELARQHRGEQARRIRSLAKPNVVAWALNQVYWSSRPAFDRLVAAAARLREAQARGLLGKAGDLRGAGTGHREALGAAVKEAATLLQAAGHEATPDALRSLTAGFEALPWEEPAGRLTRPPEPSGFAVFAGMPVAEGARVQKKAEARRETTRPREEEEEARRARAAGVARRRAEAAERVHGAEGQLARARDEERAARERLDAARRAVKDAERSLSEAQSAARPTAGSSAPPTDCS